MTRQWRYALVFICCFLGMMGAQSALARTKVRYDKKKLKAFLLKAKARHITKKLTNDKRLRVLHARLASRLARLRTGICRSISYPWIGKHCHRHCILKVPKTRRHCKFGVCVHIPDGWRCAKRATICTPYTETRHARLCMFKRGSKERVLANEGRLALSFIEKVAKSELKVLKRDFNHLKKDAEKATKDAEKAAQTVSRVAAHVFDSVVAKLKKKAKIIAKKLVPIFKTRLKSAIKKGLSKQYTQAAKIFLAKGRKALKMAPLAQHDLAETQETLRQRRKLSSEFRSYTATVAISIGMTVGIEALEVTIKCWRYGGEAKRACLRDAIADATQDGIFNISSMMLQLALDTFVIEPFSEELAGEVAVGLAAVTEGVGGIAFPIAYFASSVTLNITVALLTDAMRHPYDAFYQSTLKKKNQKWIDKLVRGLKGQALACLSPKVLCKSSYSRK
jgi:hypothetical protein